MRDTNEQINKLRDRAGQLRDGEVPMLDQAGRDKLIATTEDEVYRLESHKVDSVNEQITKLKEKISQLRDGETPMLDQVGRDKLIATTENEISELEARKIDSVSDKINSLKDKIRQIEDGEMPMLDQVGRDKLVVTTENEIRELEERKNDSIRYRISKLREDIRQLKEGEVSMLDQAGRDKLIATSEAEISELEAQIKTPTDADGVPENLPVGSVEEGEETDSGGSAPEVEPEQEGQEGEPSEAAEAIDKAEYLRLKKEFKESQRAYMEALEQDYADRNIFKKAFGLGRKEFSSPVQDAYEKFMAANQEYFSFARESGTYKKIAERLNRERSPDDIQAINPLVAGRHIFRPAEERLELQKAHMPAYVLNVKKFITEKTKAHPKTAMGVGALLLVLNPAAVAAGLGVRYAGNKFYVQGKEEKTDSIKTLSIETLDSDMKLEEYEAEYFEAIRQAHDAKVRTTAAAVGAAVTAGSVYGSEVISSFSGGESVPVGEGEVPDPTVIDEAKKEAFRKMYDENREMFGGTLYRDGVPITGVGEVVGSADQNLDVVGVATEPEGGIGIEQEGTPIAEPEPEKTPEISSEPPTESAEDATSEVIPPVIPFEAIHTVERGEVLSKIVLEALRERVSAGELQLPEGVDQNRLSHYMYQSFPEMTSASNIEPRLSVAEWQELGVKSGDPHLIRPGEEIDVRGLLEKMWGSQAETPVIPEAVTPPAEVGAQSIETPVEASGDSAPVVEEVVEGQSSEVTPEVGGAENIPSEVGSEGTVVAESVAENTGASPETGEVGVNTEAPPVSGEEVPLVPTESPEAWLYNEPRISHSLPELTTGGYEPYVSERLSEMVTTWPEQGVVSLHEYLYQIMLQGFHTGHIELPIETAEYVLENDTALYGFIEKYLPDVSEHTLSKFFRGVGSDAFTPEQWQELGIGSGNPKMIAPGDQIQTGEIISAMLERAARAVNKT